MVIRRVRYVTWGTAGVLLTLAAAGCGQAASAGPHPASARHAPAPVTLLTADPTGVMVQAGKSATFTVTAYTAGMHPAADRPVTFYVGPMTPLSGVPPKAWYATGTAGAMPYVASYSRVTNARGQAVLTLKPQGADTMEMVGIDLGNLKTYDPAAGRPLTSLDAWWTTASATPKTLPGASLTVDPWVTVAPPHTRLPLTIRAESPSGPAAGAAFTVTSPLLGSGSGMSASGTMLTAGSDGSARLTVPMGSATGYGVRIVATYPDGARVAGGIDAALLKSAYPHFGSAPASGSSGM